MTKFTQAPCDSIDFFEKEFRVFAENILGLSASSVLVTDDSSLRDFSLCGDWEADVCLPPEASLAELNSAWDSWVISRIATDYGLALESTAISMLDLLRKISNSTTSPILH